MTESSPQERPSATSPRNWAAVSAALVFVVAGFASITADRWLSTYRSERARTQVERQMRGFGFALSTTIERRAAVLDAMVAWYESDASPSADDFESFARALYGTVDGLRAIQFVESGVITRSFPPQGNEGVVGYDLLEHPDAQVVEGLERAWATGRTSLTGPIPLLQGGTGIILRRSTGPAGDTTAPLFALVLDTEPILAEAGFTGGTVEGLDVELTDRTGRRVLGREPPVDPVVREVPLPGGSWTLAAAPEDGWAESGASLWAMRGQLLSVVLLLTALTWLFVGRHRRLRRAVAERTDQLEISNRELRNALAVLERNRERLQAALAGGRVAIWEWNLETDVVRRSANVDELFGLESDNSDSSTDFLAAVHPDDRRRIERSLETAVQDGSFEEEYRIVRPDGEVRWVRDVGTRHARDGEPDRIVGAATDITRLKELEHQLLHSQKMEAIGRLAGGVAHDFNNLLSAILGFAEFALEDATEPEQRDSLEQILTAARHAAHLTSRLLAFGRRQVEQPTILEVDEVVEEAAAMLERLVGEDIRLQVDRGARGATVYMDPSQASQVLTNLTVNARDALPRGGTILIRTRRSSTEEAARTDPPVAGVVDAGEVVVIEVTDDGVGIEEAHLDRLFEPFFTTRDDGEATGLGLSTVHGIVRQAGGHIAVESAPGSGTTFRVVLPVVAGEDPEPPPAAPEARERPGAALRVLLVEDERAVRDLVERMLGQVGHRVEAVATADEALARVEDGFEPDVLLTDVVLQESDGAELAERLRTLRPGLPVLFMSGYPEDHTLPTDRGDASFLAKPFSRDELLQALTALACQRT